MSLVINGTTIPENSSGAVIYNGTDLDKVIGDGVTVWERQPDTPPPSQDTTIDFTASGFWVRFVAPGGSGSEGMQWYEAFGQNTYGLYGSSGESDWFTPYYRTKSLIDCTEYSKIVIVTASTGRINTDGGWHNNRLLLREGTAITSANGSVNKEYILSGQETHEYTFTGTKKLSVAIGIDCKLPISGHSFVGIVSMTLVK